MGGLKGLTGAEASNNAKLLLQYLEMTEFSEVKALLLSSDKKRRLSFAMSLIVWPKIGFMDQPFTGVDPCSQRGMLKTIKQISLDSAQLLMTDDIDEAAQICDNIGVLVNGKLICYGTPTYLNRCYGGTHEFSIIVNINESDYLLAQTEIYE